MKIDFEQRANAWVIDLDGGYYPFNLEQKKRRDDFQKVMESLAQEIEEETIQRCKNEMWKDGTIDRLYSHEVSKGEIKAL